MEKQQVEIIETTPVEIAPKKSFLHKLFGSTPGDGEMQPKEGISYSIAGFGQNLVCTIIGSYLTVFMTDAIGFPALAVALLMLFARLFDAANDPIMGSIVDRTRTPWGKCRPYLKWMAFPIALMTIICFLPVYPNNPGGFAAISIVYLIWGIIYTVADVPYWGLSTAMSNDTFRRGNLLTIARLLCTAGAGIVTIVVPQITSNMTKGTMTQVDALQSLINALSAAGFTDITSLADVPAAIANFLGANPTGAISEALAAARDSVTDLGINLTDGAAIITLKDSLKASVMHDLSWIYFVIAAVCVVAAIPMFFLGFKNTKERNMSLEAPPSLKHNLSLLMKNKPLMLVVLSGVLGSARMVFTYTGGLYFAKYVLSSVKFMGMQGEGLYTLITLAVVPGGLIASLLVPYFTKKIGKRHTYIWSNIVGGIAVLIAFVVGISVSKGDYTDTAVLVVAFLALIIAGVPSGFGNIITYAMIGDSVEYLELKTGERAEGICFAMQTFINKIGMAVGAFIGVLAYYIAGVEANNAAALTPAGKDTLWIMLMLIAGISFILSAIPLFFYKFNEKDQQEAVAVINERKLAAEAANDAAMNEYTAEGDEAGFINEYLVGNDGEDDADKD